jgi:serine protease Do
MKIFEQSKRPLGVLIVLALGVLVGLVVSSQVEPVHPMQPLQAFASSPPAADTLTISSDAEAVQQQFSTAVKRALPAVVSVLSSRTVKVQNPFLNNPFFRQFFGNGDGNNQAPEETERGLGSGVILSPDGYIVTNNHVVAGAQEIHVQLADKTSLEAKVIGTDPPTDLALLKVDATNLPTIVADTKGDLDIGHVVFAIGNPFGVGRTVTMGIISATGRGGLGIEDYEDFIQTDAAINPGNSGGALINLRGELVGINTAIIGRSGGNNGIGFAIPVGMVEPVISQLKATGHVVRGYIGAYIQDLTPALAEGLHTKSMEGSIVSDLSPDGPAAKAGLQKGDIITAVDGKKIADSRQLRLLIAQTKPGTTDQLTVVRNGQEMTIPVTLGTLPSSGEKTSTGGEATPGADRGITVEGLTPQIAQSLRLPASTEGVVVDQVDPEGPAADSGLQRGDVIQSVDQKPIHNPAELKAAFASAGAKPVLLLVNRQGRTFFTTVPAQ